MIALADAGGAEAAHAIPSAFWMWPFVAILLSIAILPLMRRTHHWWEQNRNKLLVSAVLALITLFYYGLRGDGIPIHHAAPPQHVEQVDAHAPEPTAPQIHAAPDEPADEAAHVETHYSEPGLSTVFAVLDHAVLKEYVPFLTLLFALYVIAGGIVVRGDIRATPTANTTILGIGAVLASLIGTTGASMVLIRLLLKTNSERKHVVHTVVFFIFLVSNIGGSLLPIGDPPLFLGYLRGVHFFWTLGLWQEWMLMVLLLLGVYWVWDLWAYRHEAVADLSADVAHVEPVHLAGTINFLWIGGVVFAVATLDSSKEFLGSGWTPFPYLREIVQLAFVGLSLATTSNVLRQENKFNYVAIGEVACVFIGIFITMQIPLEILNARGAELGLSQPWHFFWVTGMLSSFLDNAPTYVVFFETARTLPHTGAGMLMLNDGSEIREPLLVAISCGAVFMGANSYIGNGPNFMVRTIAEQSGVKMPSFFGYMLYAGAVLIPLFVIITFVFFRP